MRTTKFIFLKIGMLCALTSMSGHAAPTDTTAANAPAWKPAAGPLLTRWAKDVSPQNAHREYPRPQMTRRDWQNLNGLWQFAVANPGEDTPLGRDLSERILVPFPVESALSGVMRKADRVWYRRTFSVPQGWTGRRLLLHFGAVDWQATVYVNGRLMGAHRGGFDAFSFDITDALRAGGPQEIVVGVFDPSDAGGQPRGKQVNKPEGIFYTSSTGIWQTVWLEPVPDDAIRDLKITPDVDNNAVRLRVRTRGAANGLTVQAQVRDSGRVVAAATGNAASEIIIPLRAAKLWAPSHPFLYDLKVSLQRGGRAVDAVDSYFGMRKIEVRRATDGAGSANVTRIFLNGEPVFQVGPLDQGFWPDGLFTAPTDEALRYDIEATRRLGFNMTRKHVKVEPARWYYWADRLGLLVWQDMPGAGNTTDADKRQFERELQRMVEGFGNHPSVVMWVVFNEGWGQYDTERLTRWVKTLDPARIVNNASGWVDKNVGDVIDMHNYPGPGSPLPEANRAAVLGEFGGLGLPVPGHMWSAQNWGYAGTANSAELTRRYENLLRRSWALRDSPGTSAVVYTQLTDVETETNGLLTYDRAVFKVNADRAALANRGLLPALEIKPLVPTAQAAPINWRYSFTRPADTWFRADFNDASWQLGPAGFGTRGTPGATVRTVWNTSDIWLRREITLSAADLNAPGLLALWAHHDEDVEIYINGVLAARATGHTSNYDELMLNAAGRAALRPGRNLIAVHCRQTGGGQYIDVGLSRITEKPRAANAR